MLRYELESFCPVRRKNRRASHHFDDFTKCFARTLLVIHNEDQPLAAGKARFVAHVTDMSFLAGQRTYTPEVSRRPLLP